MTIETRTLPAELELRDGRTIIGRAVPYDVETQIGSYVEVFRPGAFAGIEPSAVPLTAPHPKDGAELPIGVSLTYSERPDGLYGEWRVSETTFGDDVLALVRDRAVTGLSIGFVPDVDVWDATRTRVERRRAGLDHVAVVRSPAYTDARIVALRTGRPRLAIARRVF